MKGGRRMKYSEFKEWLSNNDWSFSDDDCWITVTNVLSVSKQDNNVITTLNYYAGEKGFLALLKKAIELAETPLEERIDEKEYYVQLPFVNGKLRNIYLQTTEYGELIWSDLTSGPFTEQQIKDIDERLWAFAVEVEE